MPRNPRDPYGQHPNGSFPNKPYPHGHNPRETNPPRPGMPRRYAPPPAAGKHRVRLQPRFFGFLLILALSCTAAYLLLDGAGGGKNATALVKKENLGSQYQGQALILRDESLVDDERITNIDFVAEEGAMVTRNAPLCSVYSAAINQAEIDRLNKARTEIQVYHREKMSRSLDPQLEPIQNSIDSLTLDVRTVAQRAGRGSLINLERQLKVALKARQEHLSKYNKDDTTLNALYDNERAQLRKIESWTKTFSAADDCLVSFYTDGYENTVNSQTLEKLTAEDVRNVLAGQQFSTDDLQRLLPAQKTASSIALRGRQPIYRAVTPGVWYVLLLVNDQEWNPSDGQEYKMQLEGFQEYLVDARVRSSTRIGNEILVRMEVRSDVRPVLNIRTCRMVVGEHVDGFSVPIGAITEYRDSMGVVLPDASGGVFVPVTIVSKDRKNAYIRPVYPGSLQDGQQVKASF